MLAVPERPDAHTKPPGALREVFKRYQHARGHDLDDDETLVDLARPGEISNRDDISKVYQVEEKLTSALCSQFLGQKYSVKSGTSTCYGFKQIQGLHILPQVLPAEVQSLLLNRLLHRDLASACHKTNVHLHYNVDYPDDKQSFFALPPSSDHGFAGREPGRAPLTLKACLEKKLRWITLGGQYDWTAKRYPSEEHPPFPPDIAHLLQGLFPTMRPEAAIVNLYSPGDTLSLHRDVSEECDRPLVSVSLGCDAVFMAAIEDDVGCLRHVAVRLRSGDVVCMSGPARYAWHGVPQVVEGTCPEWLAQWPAPEYEAWKGWMANKRINLNVRQMYE